MALPKEIESLSQIFSSLPNIGPKLSNRLAIFLGVSRKDIATKLATTLNDTVKNVHYCKECRNITDEILCNVCSDKKRDPGELMIVEDSLDLINIDLTGEFHGFYHVLGGLISPMNGISPEDLNFQNLFNRIKNKEIKEVIMALNPNVEGEATSLYLKDKIKDLRPDITITKLAKGIPSGSDLEYISTQTIIESVRSRTIF